MLNNSVNVRDLNQVDQINEGDLLILETSSGTNTIDFQNFVVGPNNVSWYSSFLAVSSIFTSLSTQGTFASLITPTISSTNITTANISARFLNLVHVPANDGANPNIFIGEGTTADGLTGFNIFFDELLNQLTVSSSFSGVVNNTFVADRNGNIGLGSTAPSTRLEIVNNSALDTATPGKNNFYGLHFNGQTTQDYAGGITWNGGNAGAQAGIYVQGSGLYGTKMYFGTTDNYNIGSKTSMMIDHKGNTLALSGIGFIKNGGTVTQPSSKGDAVTMHAPAGKITVATGNIAYPGTVSFTFYNFCISSTDIILLQQQSGVMGGYNITALPASGYATITIRNVSNGALNETFDIRFAVIKTAAS